MEELKVLGRGEENSAPGFPQSRKRRASAITVRIQKRLTGEDPEPRPPFVPELRGARNRAAPANGSFPESAGSLLIVREPTGDRQSPAKAARLAGLQVLEAKNPEEALQILGEREFPVDLLLILPHPSMSSSAADLIRKSVETRPGLHVLLMMASGQREEMRAGYEAGAVSIILDSSSTPGLVAFFQQSLAFAREGRRRNLRHRERRERHDSGSPARRVLRTIQSWAKALLGSRQKAGLAVIAAAAVSLLIGMGIALALERSYRAGDRYEAMANRVLEGMNRIKSPVNRQEAALLYGQTVEQIGLTREANEVTRRYYQEHLQELRMQNALRSSTSSGSIAGPAPDPQTNLRK